MSVWERRVMFEVGIRSLTNWRGIWVFLSERRPKINGLHWNRFGVWAAVVLGPVAVVDGKVFGRLTQDKIPALLKEFK